METLLSNFLIHELFLDPHSLGILIEWKRSFHPAMHPKFTEELSPLVGDIN